MAAALKISFASTTAWLSLFVSGKHATAQKTPCTVLSVDRAGERGTHLLFSSSSCCLPDRRTVENSKEQRSAFLCKSATSKYTGSGEGFYFNVRL